MLTWQHSEWLYALALLAPGWILFGWYRRRQRQSWMALGAPQLLCRMGVSLEGNKQVRRMILMSLAFVSLILALANPQIGRRYERVKQRGVDVILALDVSESMLAEDEQPNRLSRAKLLISRFLDRLNGDRIGLIIFAGDAYVQVPLTGDYQAAESILRPVSPGMVSRQGTSLSEAIGLAQQAFAVSRNNFRALFVNSDGETHDEEALEMAVQARENGLRVHCIGLGSEQGAVIPQYLNGQITGNKRDRNGQTVVTKMNSKMLASVSEAGGGRFFRLNDIGQTLAFMDEELDQMTEVEFEERFITDYEDHFSWMLALAMIFMLMEGIRFGAQKEEV